MSLRDSLSDYEEARRRADMLWANTLNQCIATPADALLRANLLNQCMTSQTDMLRQQVEAHQRANPEALQAAYARTIPRDPYAWISTSELDRP